MRLKYFLFIILLGTSTLIFAQIKNENIPIYEGTVTSMEHVPSIASRLTLISSREKDVPMEDGRTSGNMIVPYKDQQIEDDYFAKNPNALSQKVQARTPDLVFDAYASSSQPTDPDLAIGPNHVFVVFNTGFRIFDKNGNALTGQLSPNPTIFPSSGCCDLTVSHDSAADRWVISFLKDIGGAMIAVSDGPDPINDGWYVYTISAIQDYQKLSIWSDGYYITENTSNSNKVWAMERSKMLVGNTAAKVVGFNLPGIVTSGFFSPQVFNISAGQIPVAGNTPIVYLQDNAWSGVSEDHIKLWFINMDWTTTANSTISSPQQINTTPFISVFDNGSYSNLSQPNGGSAIDALQATIMNQAQFRKFPTHNSAVFNFVVDTDASNGELAGIRWLELRQAGDDQPWSLYQEGTYTAPDNKHAWHGSMIMDVQGNIGMGYTAMSSTSSSNTNVKVSSYYTGRFANDPLGTMTISEQLIASGNTNISGTRYGDYNKIDVDPADDKTFYFINEYNNNGRKGVVGRFKIAPNFNNDIGVVTINTPSNGILSANETISVTVFNYGQNDVSNFPISYQIDGGNIITETYTGTIASNSFGNFSFSTTGNFSSEGHTYSIYSYTSLVADEDNSNNGVTKQVTNIFNNDLGITAISSPESGNNLGSLPVTVTIKNFGGMAQSNFNVAYFLNANSPIVEQVNVTIQPGATYNYTFSTMANLSEYTTHNLTVSTQLTNDGVMENNSLSKSITNSSCFENLNNTQYSIGPNANTTTTSIINISDNQVITKVTCKINLTHSYNSDLDIFLKSPANTSVELSTDNGGSGDNYTNTIFDDAATTLITSGTSPFDGIFKPEGLLSSFNGENSQGNWILSISDDANNDGGNLLNWTLNICYSTLGIYDNVINSSDLNIAEVSLNQFDINWETQNFNKSLFFSVYTILGQKIVNYKVKNENGKYSYFLDMSYASPGVYLVRIGNNDFAKVSRIIVK